MRAIEWEEHEGTEVEAVGETGEGARGELKRLGALGAAFASRPWLLLGAFFLLGTCVGGASAGGWWALLGLALAGLWRWPAVCTAILGLAAGAVATGAPLRWAALAPDTPVSPVMGTVQELRVRGARAEVLVSPDTAPSHRVAAPAPLYDPQLGPGARVRIDGTLRRPRPADNPGELDRVAWRARQGVFWEARGPVRLTTPAEGWAQAPIAARRAAREALGRSDRPIGAAVLTGVLLGDRAAVPPEAVAAFEATGTAHLLAVSGLHVGGLALVVAALAGWIARRALAVRPSRWALLAGLPAALALVVLAQTPLSAQRAGVMIAAYLTARALGRRTDAGNWLGAAALFVLAGEPQAASGPAFQFSFGAVAALLLLARGRGLRGAAMTALVACLAAGPVQAAHFGTASPLAPVANLLLTPLAAAVLVPLGALGLVLSPLTTLPLDAAARLAEALFALAEALAEGGGGLQIVGAAAAPALAAPLAALAGWLLGLPRLGGVVTVALLAASALAWPRGATADFVAVGQGDAVLLRADGGTALVDAGPDPRAGTLLAYLRHEGVRRLDWVVISHAHPDHYAGLLTLAGQIPVGVVYTNGRRGPGPMWVALERALDAAGVPLLPVDTAPPGGLDLGAGESGLRVQVLLGSGPADAGENDASVALRVEGAGSSLLLTGDLEGPGEVRLVASGTLTPADVLKAGHHTSRTSTSDALLDRVRPRAVVGTLGRDNRFGFPHPEVIERLRARQLPLWRTDRHGRVRLRLGPEATSRAALTAFHPAPVSP